MVGHVIGKETKANVTIQPAILQEIRVKCGRQNAEILQVKLKERDNIISEDKEVVLVIEAGQFNLSSEDILYPGCYLQHERLREW